MGDVQAPPRSKMVYKEDDTLAGQKHKSGRHRECRKGFFWKVDVVGAEPVPVGESRVMMAQAIGKHHLSMCPADFMG